MDRQTIRLLSQPRTGDSDDLAEIRAWLAKQPDHELWGLTPATRIAWLLQTLDTLGAELKRSFR
jgi:hypothetical protein